MPVAGKETIRKAGISHILGSTPLAVVITGQRKEMVWSTNQSQRRAAIGVNTTHIIILQELVGERMKTVYAVAVLRTTVCLEAKGHIIMQREILIMVIDGVITQGQGHMKASQTWVMVSLPTTGITLARVEEEALPTIRMVIGVTAETITEGDGMILKKMVPTEMKIIWNVVGKGARL